MLSELDILVEKHWAIESQSLVELLKYSKREADEALSVEEKQEC